MIRQPIELNVKIKCVELNRSGKNSREVYDEYFSKNHQGMNYESFRKKLKIWKKQSLADDLTLSAGTYGGFVAHGATVQVDGNGKIVQAWVKQSLDDSQYSELLEAIKENAKPVELERPTESDNAMLEIPLFDMHFPLSEHKETLAELIDIISSRNWEEINVVIGQDLFHNDDMRGRTSSGRPIEKVDIPLAWRMARDFWHEVLKICVQKAEFVSVIYSKGNHDECLAWAFVQSLKESFPQIKFDDSLKPRKAIHWRGCFVGITHGNGAKSQNQDLRGQFTIEFPMAFANSKVREIHCWHLHHEKEADVYGVMLRRLSRNGATDEWSENEGFVGAHKRFMIFEYTPARLRGIYYI